jgi:hypothetical protein
MGKMNRVQFLAGVMMGFFSLFQHIQVGSGAHPASYPMGTRVDVVKWLRHETGHSSPSSAKVKNAWSYTSTPPVHFHGILFS